MNAVELKERIWGKTLIGVQEICGRGIVYQFLLYMFDDPRKVRGTVAEFVCKLPDEEVDRMFEEFQQKYAQQQIEQEL